MMTFSEDQIALAAEYALGTLDADERAQVETTMGLDPDFAALVEDWIARLGPLNQMVGRIEPAPELWARIKAALGIEGASEPVAIPAELGALRETTGAAAETAGAASGEAETVLPPAMPVANENAAVAEGDAAVVMPAPTPGRDASSAAPAGSAEIIPFAAARRWRGIALMTGAIAACLLALVVAQIVSPDSVPQPLRPKQRVQIAQAPAPQPAPQVAAPMPAQYVAVLQQNANSPAFILTVDAAMKTFMVRRVGAQPEPGKSYELWLVSDRLQRPRSLGVIGARDFTARSLLSAFDPEMVGKATYAVTMEPEGGSPTGVATGPVVYTGKLVESVPSDVVIAPAGQPQAK